MNSSFKNSTFYTRINITRETIRVIFPILLFIISCTPSYDYSHIKVIDVIDGDTIKLANGKLLRYIGLDTPELRIKKGGKFIYSPQPFSKEATEFNQKLVANKFITVEFDVERVDRYGRLLGYCFVDDTFVNARLIEEGFATLYTWPPNIKYVDLLVNSQKKARQEKKGLWGAYETIHHTQANQYINQIRTVEGKVVNTYQSPKCVFLNFGSNYRTDFTVVIFNNVLASFHEKGIDPLTFYKGKRIRLSGRIREYNGPEIIVNTPHEIQVIAK